MTSPDTTTHAFYTRIRRARTLAPLILLAVLFVSLAVLTHGSRLIALDVRITRLIQWPTSHALNMVMEVMTQVGGTITLMVLGIGIWLALRRGPHRIAGTFSLLSLLGLPLNLLIKQAVDRSRPTSNLVTVVMNAAGLSFPSGHAMASGIFYGFLAVILWTWVPTDRERRFGAVLLVFLCAVVGLSRVYLGVHWFSDVLGGWIAALFFLILLEQGFRAAVETAVVRSEVAQVEQIPEPGQPTARDH